MYRGKVTQVDSSGAWVTTADFGLLGPCQWSGSRPVAGDIVLIADVGAAASPDLVIVGQVGTVATTGVQQLVASTGASFSVLREHIGCLVTLSHGSLITVTLPSDASVSIPIGGRIDFSVLGAGMAIFAAGSGATVNGTPSLTTRAQYSAASAIKRAADTWLLMGDMA